jgi:hypothetical protein
VLQVRLDHKATKDFLVRLEQQDLLVLQVQTAPKATLAQRVQLDQQV